MKIEYDCTNKFSLAKNNGQRAEQLARQLITKNQHKIISVNYQCRFGEVDIISLDKNQLIFTEVRHRSNNRFGGAVQSITHIKQSKIIQTAQYFMTKNPHLNKLNARFDVVCFENHLEIELATWIQDAF